MVIVILIVCKRERGGRDGGRDGKRERQRERQTDRQTDRQRERDRETDREREIERDRQTDRQRVGGRKRGLLLHHFGYDVNVSGVCCGRNTSMVLQSSSGERHVFLRCTL